MIPEHEQNSNQKSNLQMNWDFRETFRRFYPNVCRQLTYILGDPVAAEDLAQDTFLKMYENPPADLSNPGGWLARVAANLAYNYLRSGKRRTEREARETALQQSRVIPIEEAFILRSELDSVRSALDRLPDRDRICLLLKYSGFSYAEISVATGVPVSSMGTVLARAQQHFRQVYGGADKS